MMGSEESSREEMESLVLDDSLTSKSYSNYKSAMTTLSDSGLHHPLATPADTDPLLSPPMPLSPPKKKSVIRNANSPDNSYVEPPSYADVVFSPLDAGDGFEINSVESPSRDSEKSPAFSRSPSSSSSEYLKISVSNPQKEVETSNSIVPGGNAYVTYLITTRTNMLEFGGSDFIVRRRFRDVVTLSDRLSEVYRGFFIPPRPDKSVVEGHVMQKQEFVEQRRVALERYLRRLAQHPVIKKSDELRVFLQVQGRLPLPTSTDVASRMLDGAVKLPKQLLGDSGSFMGPQDVVHPAKGGRDLLRIFKELKQSVTNDWGGSKPPVEEEDKEFLEKKERLRDLEQHISNASQQAESLVKAQQDMGETMGGLGLALMKLTKFENENAMLNTQRVRAADMRNVATTTVKASRLYRGLNAQTVEHLDTLHDYLGLMLAVHNAFSDRSSALLTVQTLLSELSSLHSRAEKLETGSSNIFGADKSKIRKTEEFKETIRVTEDAKNCAIREYERIKENNKSEIERLDRERRDDFVNMLKGFVINQVAYSEKIGNEWAKVVEDTSRYAKESA
ncbi:Sorting nexin 2B like [Actinidia chinensis var. chinensis]|uniref:Sorting nexin 2B like n=1 Tax=Actinidia chinensis var. chinensis TaxID=1590841 RepID=A0A2R6QJE3_ACTCC|nr:Sorting nexin 2B like [Actinidia chinensis var. chinensis]